MEFKDKVVYQIYPKSFYDSNGDGFGDLRGIIEKLDYLEYLGADWLWLTPFFPSPQRDNGYDVANYRAIDPRYGTMEDFEELCRKAKSRGIELMLDMVFNHTSTQHKWFQKAIQGEKKYQDYYIFKAGDPKMPPTNWVSKFGGNAWRYEKSLGLWYLHLFDVTQADLNWDNPAVRKETADIINFWMEKGVSGFRFDVVNLISKGAFENDYQGDGRRFYTDGPRVHQYLKELNRNSFGKGDCLTVGEMSSTSLENCTRYAGAGEGELSMVFSFHHLKVDYKDGKKWEEQPFDFLELKRLLFQWQTGMEQADAWNALFWCNHDQPRVVSRFGDDKAYRKEAAKMLATAIHFMRGTPYIYQGEEIGMTNAGFQHISQYRDVESLNYFQILKEQGKSESEIYHILGKRSRDNARTPMQWNGGEKAGFTTGTPWIEPAGNYREIHVKEAMEDPDSILQYYRKLIALRKEYPVIQEGTFLPMLEAHPAILAYERKWKNQSLLVFTNFYGKEAKASIPKEAAGYRLVLGNYPEKEIWKGETLTLRPYEAAVFLREKQAAVC